MFANGDPVAGYTNYWHGTVYCQKTDCPSPGLCEKGMNGDDDGPPLLEGGLGWIGEVCICQ
jgi:hypothetical protein